MIKFEGVRKVYDDGFCAIDDINLEFLEGKINVLIGPSGCGKTTTMKMINRLIEHTSGTILIDDKDVNAINPIELRRSIGYVIQNIGLFPHMTIFDNVATVPKLLKWDKKKIKNRVEELLRLVNLEPETFSNRYPSELSGGQQQRIGVIRALAAEPSIILMDEPFSALDPISREQLQDELIRLQTEINKTIVFVTHDMDEALKIADQIILMRDGVIEQMGSPEELLEHPANDFVKDFIGLERMSKAKRLPKVEEIMRLNPPVINVTETTVDDAINVMLEHQLSAICLVNEKDEYIGNLSLFQALKNKEKPIRQVMEPPTFCVIAKKEMEQVLGELPEDRSMDIPVLDDKNRVVGIITVQNLAVTLQNFYAGRNGATA